MAVSTRANKRTLFRSNTTVPTRRTRAVPIRTSTRSCHDSACLTRLITQCHCQIKTQIKISHDIIHNTYWKHSEMIETCVRGLFFFLYSTDSPPRLWARCEPHVGQSHCEVPHRRSAPTPSPSNALHEPCCPGRLGTCQLRFP